MDELHQQVQLNTPSPASPASPEESSWKSQNNILMTPKRVEVGDNTTNKIVMDPVKGLTNGLAVFDNSLLTQPRTFTFPDRNLTLGSEGVSLVAAGTFSVSVSGAITNLVSITGLLGDTDIEYDLEFFVENGGNNMAAGIDINSSGAGWHWQQMYSVSNAGAPKALGTVTNTPEAAAWIIGNLSDFASPVGSIARVSIKAVKDASGGNYRVFNGTAMNFNSSQSPYTAVVSGANTNTSTQLTSLQIVARHSAGTFTITGRYSLLKRKYA